MKKCISLLVWLVAMQFVAARSYDVRDFGAKGDGQTIDSPAFNAAIEAASRDGGGTVIIPAGIYAAYSIRLKSNLCLQFEPGAVLLAAPPTVTDGYDAPEPNEYQQYQDFGHSHWHNSLLWAENGENISICGQGLINGAGLNKGEARTLATGIGNKAIALKQCHNVLLRDLKMLNCGHFALLATGVDNLTISNLLVDTNRDALDIDCCRNVRVSDCSINTPSDDGIVLKACYSLGSFKNTENVTVVNCMVSGYDAGSLLDGTFRTVNPNPMDGDLPYGRIKIGTESSGGFKNIAITNCTFQHCRGLALETVDGGALEDIVISNISMRDIFNSPIFIRLGGRMRSPQGTAASTIKRVSIENVNVYNADSRYACLISGLPDRCIEDVSISNLRIVYKGGGTAEQASLIVPENEKKYPEPDMFGIIPASSFYIRHARNIRLRNIEVSFLQPDYRPSIVLNDVINAQFAALEIPVYNKAKSVVLQNSDKPVIVK